MKGESGSDCLLARNFSGDLEGGAGSNDECALEAGAGILSRFF